MGKPLKVLIVEDCEDDMILLLRELTKGGFEPEYQVVDNAKDMAAALEKDWEIIISDYSMPTFNGVEALHLMKSSGIDLPFIIISGTIGEDTAVAAMRKGAHDYMMKGKLGRLIPAIERELREASIRKERNAALEELKQLSARNENILATVPDIIMETNVNNIYTWANKAGLEFFGNDVIGKDAEYYFEGEKESYDVINPFLKSNKDVVYFESLQMRKDGVKRLLAWWSCPLRNEKEKITGILSTARDITEQKRDEQIYQMMFNIAHSVNITKNKYELYKVIQKELNVLIDTTNLFIGLYNEEKNTISFPYMIDRHDSFKEVSANNTISSIVIKEKKSLFLKEKNILDMKNEGKIKIVGTLAKVWMGVPLRANDNVFGIIAVQNYKNENAYTKADLSILEFVANQAAVSIKKKMAEEQLIKLSRTVEQSSASVIITNTKGNIEYVNPKFTQLTGYSSQEIMGENPRILKSGGKASKEYKELWDTLISGREWKGEFHNKKKDGTLYWESASISPIRNTEGEITHFLAVKEDISAQKKMEQQLQQAQKNGSHWHLGRWNCS